MFLKFTALEVGSGDAFLLEEDERKVLFDSGGNQSLIVKLLKKNEIEKIDLAICSHNDADHANGFIGLLKSNIPVKEMWLPGTWASIIHSVACFMKHECRLCNGRICWVRDYYIGMRYLKNDMDERQLYDELLSSPKEDISEGQLVEDIEYINLKMAQSCENCSKYNESEVGCHFCAKRLLDVSDYKMRRMRKTAAASKVNFDRIIKIAELAYKRCVNVRWFEPTNKSAKSKVGSNFILLNANPIAYVRQLGSPMLLAYALSLTVENEYSLILEYLHNDIPVVRFSADSNLLCQGQQPYSNCIIVTAPHHGSKVNKDVYINIKGNDIIWVRSDATKKTQGRPCEEFKKRIQKYCLSCKHRKPVISEICFVYDYNSKKWIHQSGELCVCKP